jgi:hypothetical protein
VPLFRRRQSLHRRPAGPDDLSSGEEPRPAPAPAAAPPGWDGEPRGEPGIHGVARARRWDSVVDAEAPGLAGDEVRFAGLPEGPPVVEGDAAPAAVEPLARAVERTLPPPYRAEAVRREGQRWSVAAVRIEVARVPGLEGEEAQLVATSAGRSLSVDGRPSFVRAPALEQAGEAHGAEYVVRARRLRGELWEVDATAL